MATALILSRANASLPELVPTSRFASAFRMQAASAGGRRLPPSSNRPMFALSVGPFLSGCPLIGFAAPLSLSLSPAQWDQLLGIKASCATENLRHRGGADCERAQRERKKEIYIRLEKGESPNAHTKPPSACAARNSRKFMPL